MATYKFKKPIITESTINYYQDSITIGNKPKLIVVIENKSVPTSATEDGELGIQDAGIDYNNKDTNSSNNIFNYISKKHGELIENVMGDYGIVTSNTCFAYHYLVDRKGNVYKGRDHNLRPFNLDLYEVNEDNSYSLISTKDNIFSDFIIIMTEEPTDDMDTTNEVYASLVNLINYLKDELNIKEYYCFSELYYYDMTGNPDFTYNNPGAFFKFNELRSSTDFTLLETLYTSPKGVEIYTYGKRPLQYQRSYMSGNDVFLVQKMLYTLGYLSSAQVNGKYDLNTQNAMKSFQSDNYITSEYGDGNADYNTLDSLRYKVYSNKINKLLIVDDSTELFRVLKYTLDDGEDETTNENKLKLMSGADIVHLQEALQSKISCTQTINGIYDAETRDNVIFFQKYFLNTSSIDADGKVGPMTWRYLTRLKTVTTAISEDLVYDPENTSFTYSAAIATLQEALNYLYDAHLNANGIYDSNTANFIRTINSIEENQLLFEVDTDDLSICTLSEYDYIIKQYMNKK